jgi:predicted phosphodiesterase
VLSDIHGNRTALEAVIADGRDRGVDTWWALGDLVAIGPDPVDTLELLANVSKVLVTRGNTERYVLTRDRPPPDAEDVRAHPELVELFATVEASFSWTSGAVAAHGWLPWLAALPLEARTELEDGTRLLGVHASPGRDDGAGITPHRLEEDLRVSLEGAGADIVLAGHTHQPTDRRIGHIRAVNGGLSAIRSPMTCGQATSSSTLTVTAIGSSTGECPTTVMCSCGASVTPDTRRTTTSRRFSRASNSNTQRNDPALPSSRADLERVTISRKGPSLLRKYTPRPPSWWLISPGWRCVGSTQWSRRRGFVQLALSLATRRRPTHPIWQAPQLPWVRGRIEGLYAWREPAVRVRFVRTTM